MLNAAKDLYNLYQNQIKPFVEFRDALCDGVRFMGKSDEELLREGITNIPKENQKMNSLLQAKENAVAEKYNDEMEQAKRSSAYKILEEYLFGIKKDIE